MAGGQSDSLRFKEILMMSSFNTPRRGSGFLRTPAEVHPNHDVGIGSSSPSRMVKASSTHAFHTNGNSTNGSAQSSSIYAHQPSPQNPPQNIPRSSSSPSSSTPAITCSSSKLLPFDRFSDWLHSICVVTFDIELGQAIERIYPTHAKLTEQEKSNICYLAFPDSNSGCMGDTQYHFRTKLCTKHRRKSFSSLPSQGLYDSYQEYNENCLRSLEADDSYVYGYVYFRQIKDRSARRGYFQKSLVMISRLPFVTFFKTITSIIANEFFDKGPTAIDSACRDMDQWPEPTPGSTENLNLYNLMINVHIPHKSEKLNTASPIRENSSSANSSVINSMMEMDIGNGSSHVNISNDGVIQRAPSQPSSIHVSCSTTSPNIIIIPSVHDLNLFNCFFPILNHIQLLWELVLTCEPLIVMAPTPDVTCEVVQALVASIWPLKYSSDFRPFFTIHDSEFKEYTSTQTAPPPAILGVTNPFFAKTLQHWPHVIRIGEYPSSPKRMKKIQSSSATIISNISNMGSPSSAFDAGPGVHSKTKPFLVKDRNILKKILKGIENSRPSEVQRALIRRYLLELTQTFMIPLERYLASLMPLQKNVSPFKSAPLIQPFNQDDFFKSIESTGGPNLTSGIRGDWIGLYKRFFRSANFSSWFESRYQEVNQQLELIHLKSIFEADLLTWVQNKSEIEIIDLLLTLKQKVDSLKKGLNESRTRGDKSTDRIERLQHLIQDIIKVLPPDLHPLFNK